MQQHPVPQNVTQYQFRLVGDMTLKQFLELALGLVLAYLFWSSNLVFLIKWPLALASILFGFGLAFFPIEDRPLDQWIINFLKSIYAPTRYIWKKSSKVPQVFTFEPHVITEAATSVKTVKAPIPESSRLPANSDLSDHERQRLNVLESILAQATPAPRSGTPNSSHPQKTIVDKPSITVRKLKPLTQLQNTTIFQATPRPQPFAKTQINLNDNLQIPNISVTSIAKPAPITAPKTQAAENIVFAKPSAPPATKPAPTVTPAQIRLPAAPSTPNLVVGMVVDRAGKIVENAIVEILSPEGIPARAIKTNSLGQFYTSTPLSPGDYTLRAEKDDYSFPPNKLEVKNQIIPPLLIQAS